MGTQVDDGVIAAFMEDLKKQVAGTVPSTADSKNRPTAEVVYAIALDRFTLGRDAETNVALAVDGTRGLAFDVRGDVFASMLNNFVFEDTGFIPSKAALTNAIFTLDGQAKLQTCVDARLRVANSGGVVWLDMVGDDDHVVRLDSSGWQFLERASAVDVPVFRRPPLQSPYVVPVEGGDIGELWRVLNIQGNQRGMLLGWIVFALLNGTASFVSYIRG
ncbi:hypothetical protein [Bifidobacterium sp.]|jgi:hypothetical protein|uniref:hypothetical protein n=1 Tax=Bifidobacterium sp. TaxID=41200 RepID=UPI0025BAC47F|nr:hypothetical protein [Bifidobacterium sp.]MCI1635856.1 hypothetical protein [Bifidobacterium sp.]